MRGWSTILGVRGHGPHMRSYSPLIMIFSGNTLEWDVVCGHKRPRCHAVIVVVLWTVWRAMCDSSHKIAICGPACVRGGWWIGQIGTRDCSHGTSLSVAIECAFLLTCLAGLHHAEHTHKVDLAQINDAIMRHPTVTPHHHSRVAFPLP